MNSKRMIGIVVAGLTALTMASAYARAIGDAGNDANTQPSATAAVTVDPAVVQAQIEAAKDQAALINQIADKFQAEAASQFRGNFDALEWKLNFGARLMYQPASALATALSAGNLGAMKRALTSVGTAKHGSDFNQVITLLPNPCRIVDTRFGGGGDLGPSARLWYAANTPAVIAAQGGNAAGCLADGTGIDSFLLYVTVVPPGAPLSGGANFLTVRHDPGVPTTATVNYVPGINVSVFAVTACQGCGATGGFYAYASSFTDVVIDLVGYGGQIPVTSLFASINANGTTARGLHDVSSSRLSLGNYQVNFDRTITACAFIATIGNPGTGTSGTGQIEIDLRAGTTDAVFVETKDSAGTLVDRAFYVYVNCP